MTHYTVFILFDDFDKEIDISKFQKFTFKIKGTKHCRDGFYDSNNYMPARNE